MPTNCCCAEGRFGTTNRCCTEGRFGTANRCCTESMIQASAELECCAQREEAELLDGILRLAALG